MADEQSDLRGGAIAAEKKAVRAAVRAALDALTPAQRALASAAVCRRVMALPAFEGARVVMLFAPTPDEIDLTPILQRCQATARRVCLPRMNWDDSTMEPAEMRERQLVGWGDLAGTKFGLRQPPATAPVTKLADIDLVIVPGVAFDRQRHRLGRGAGFYDRFLAQAELRRAFCLGVGFAAQLVDHVPHAPHDRPVNAVITDATVIARPSSPRAT